MDFLPDMEIAFYPCIVHIPFNENQHQSLDLDKIKSFTPFLSCV